MYYYQAYGLYIQSSIPLPELIRSNKHATDIIVQRGKLDFLTPKEVGKATYFHFTKEEAFFYWKQIGKFLVRNGNEIIVDSHEGIDDPIIRLPLLGSVLAALLHQRGSLVLHASAVAMNGTSVAFLGNKGMGKSTIAAALLAMGHNILVDDLLSVDSNSTENSITSPAFPRLKLWPDSVVSLGDDLKNWDFLNSHVDKRVRRVSERFQSKPLLLNRIYVLAKGPSLEIDSIPPKDAFFELLRHLFLARYFQTSDLSPSSFYQLTNLAKKTPIFWLKRPDSLSLLSDMAELVEQHYQSVCNQDTF